MSGILLDGWTLATVLSEIENEKTSIDEVTPRVINTFFTALLLWDKIEWLQNSMFEYSKDKMPQYSVMSKLNEVLHENKLPDFNRYYTIISVHKLIHW